MDICATMIRGVLFLLFGCSFLIAHAQVGDTVVSWQPQWQVLRGDRLEPSAKWARETTGYFAAPKSTGTYVLFSSRGPFSLWVNRSFLADYSGRTALSLDSLRDVYGADLWIGVRTRHGLGDVRVALQLPTGNIQRPFLQHLPARDIRNFIIVIACVLFGYGIIVWRISPRLFSEYFNAARIVSTRERDETLLLRITSSQNILYYFFLGAWLAFLIVLLVASDPGAAIHMLAPTEHFAQLMLNWVALVLLIVTLLFAKYALQLIFSGIYAVLEHAADQFFTFVRLCFLVALVVSIWLFGAYLFGITIDGPYAKAIGVLLIFSLISIPFMQIRLMKGSAFRMFHIFSYLCLTEVIPLIVTFRILYY
jgi:hypothetical protein